MLRKFCIFFMITGLLACDETGQHYAAVTLTGFTMGTTYTVKLNDFVEEKSGKTIQETVERILEEINASMSTYRDDSELSRLNQSPGEIWIQVSPELFRVIETALEIGFMSNGAFDPTIGPVVNLWGFGPVQRNGLPDDMEITQAMQLVGLDKISLDRQTQSVKKTYTDVYIDLSGIAKGYAVDRVAEVLEEEYSLQNYLVEIGGEIRSRGINPEGDNWQIGIEKPEIMHRSINTIISIGDNSLATSGDYRNFIEIDGIQYSHTIDPETGRPVTHSLASVTVIQPECMYADAWATALLVAGPGKGIELANRHGIAALFLVRENNGYTEMTSNAFSTFLAAVTKK